LDRSGGKYSSSAPNPEQKIQLRLRLNEELSRAEWAAKEIGAAFVTGIQESAVIATPMDNQQPAVQQRKEQLEEKAALQLEERAS
jgi:hypothetical protein